jgi:phage RecT family recombinase
VERLMRSIMISVEKTPALLRADRQSLLNASMSAACLGLEVDGVTGQAFFIPFAGKAQLVIGYKGMNTMAARSGYTVQGSVVRDGDGFDYELGDKGYVRHKPKLGNKAPIIAAWATASSNNRPSIISVLGIDDLMAVKGKSPGAKRSDSPWNDPAIGFPAMCEKTAKRRLARSMPLNLMQHAAALDEAYEERGHNAWIDPNRGLQIDGEIVADRPAIHHEQRSTAQLLSPRNAGPGGADDAAPERNGQPGEVPGAAEIIPTATEYASQWAGIIEGATNADQLASTWNGQKDLRDAITWPDDDTFKRLKDKVGAAIKFLKA